MNAGSRKRLIFLEIDLDLVAKEEDQLTDLIVTFMIASAYMTSVRLHQVCLPGLSRLKSIFTFIVQY